MSAKVDEAVRLLRSMTVHELAEVNRLLLDDQSDPGDVTQVRERPRPPIGRVVER